MIGTIDGHGRRLLALVAPPFQGEAHGVVTASVIAAYRPAAPYRSRSRTRAAETGPRGMKTPCPAPSATHSYYATSRNGSFFFNLCVQRMDLGLTVLALGAAQRHHEHDHPAGGRLWC